VHGSRSIAVAVACSLLALTARAQDGGPFDAGISDGAIGCDAIPPLGACQRTYNLYCDYNTDTMVRYNCAQLTPDGGIPVGCGLVDCTDSGCYGYACLSPRGGFCDGQHVFCEEGAGQGCTAIPWVGSAGGTCQDAGPCDPATYVPRCDGELLTWCPLTRIWSFSCSSGGIQPYVCGEGSAGKTCLGTAGGACNLAATPPYECASGYRCNSEAGSGLCAPAPDSGNASDAVADGTNGGSSDARPASADENGNACGCRSVAGPVPAIAAALALLGLGRRRRR
jgi:hypothetical protein